VSEVYNHPKVAILRKFATVYWQQQFSKHNLTCAKMLRASDGTLRGWRIIKRRSSISYAGGKKRFINFLEYFRLGKIGVAVVLEAPDIPYNRVVKLEPHLLSCRSNNVTSTSLKYGVFPQIESVPEFFGRFPFPFERVRLMLGYDVTNGNVGRILETIHRSQGEGFGITENVSLAVAKFIYGQSVTDSFESKFRTDLSEIIRSAIGSVKESDIETMIKQDDPYKTVKDELLFTLERYSTRKLYNLLAELVYERSIAFSPTIINKIQEKLKRRRGTHKQRAIEFITFLKIATDTYYDRVWPVIGLQIENSSLNELDVFAVCHRDGCKPIIQLHMITVNDSLIKKNSDIAKMEQHKHAIIKRFRRRVKVEKYFNGEIV